MNKHSDIDETLARLGSVEPPAGFGPASRTAARCSTPALLAHLAAGHCRLRCCRQCGGFGVGF